MSGLVVLPPAPKRYSQRDQIELRRILQQVLRDFELRLRTLENPTA